MAGPIFNRVTETAPCHGELWLLRATWRGGHDQRPFLLENIYRDRADADAHMARIQRGEHGFGPSFTGYTSVSLHRIVVEGAVEPMQAEVPE